MLTRRTLVASAAAASVATAARQARAADSFAGFVAGLRADARRSGVSERTLDAALTGLQPNAKVLELDRRQPEFTLTWEQYRASRLSDTRIANGRAALAQNRATLAAVNRTFGVDPGIIVGVWGLETNYGTNTGGFGVVEALATLAWEGRRASYFRSEAMTALRIIDHGDVASQRMTGSYAGAMGQPQFMPSSYLRYAIDFDRDGRRDIWDSKPDSLASIANYLTNSGWRVGEPWGQPVRLAVDFPFGETGRERRRPLGEWMHMGVRRADGTRFARGDVLGAVVLPDGPSGQAFMVYPNFGVLRRYNPSDFYALAVGLLGDTVAA